MFTVNRKNGYFQLLWQCPQCGRKKVLGENTGGRCIVACFEPPLEMRCCGENECIQFVEAKTVSDGHFHILT